MLIMTPADADLVRGLTVLGHALAPVPLADGTFALPEACLTDPFHASKWPIMQMFDIMLDSNVRQGVRSNPEDMNSPTIDSDYSQDQQTLYECTYRSDWPVGVTVQFDPITKTRYIDFPPSLTPSPPFHRTT